MSVKSNWFTVLFKSSISLLIFCLVGLSINESEVWKYPTVIVELSISPFNSVNLCFIYFKALFGAYTFINCCVLHS